MIYVFSVQALIHGKQCRHGWASAFEPFENVALQQMLLLIWKFKTGMIDNLDAIIPVRVVGGGNHYSGCERTRAGDIRDTRCRDQSRKPGPHALPFEPSGDVLRQPSATFTSINSDH